VSHSSSNPEQEQRLSETMKKLFGEYPDGRMRRDDEGAVAVVIGHEQGRVTMQFPKNLNWIGFTADQSIDIANSLIEHARACGSQKPLTVRIK